MERMRPTAYKIGEGERRGLSKDMQEIICAYEEENKKLKSDLSECECSMHYENDEVGYRKRECKKLKEELEYFKKSDYWIQEAERWKHIFTKEQKKANRKAIENTELRKSIKILKAELNKYKKLYEHSMGEDDELIYEEGLYD